MGVRMIGKIAPLRVMSVAMACLSLVAPACSDSPTSPNGTAVVTFSVVGETFRVQLVGDKQIEAARAAQGGGPARIPNGRIVPGAGVNTGWSWHLEDVEFAEAAIRYAMAAPPTWSGRVPSSVAADIVHGARACRRSPCAESADVIDQRASCLAMSAGS